MNVIYLISSYFLGVFAKLQKAIIFVMSALPPVCNNAMECRIMAPIWRRAQTTRDSPISVIGSKMAVNEIHPRRRYFVEEGGWRHGVGEEAHEREECGTKVDEGNSNETRTQKRLVVVGY